MKKFLLSLIALLGVTSYALADEVTVEDVQIRAGKSASAMVYLKVEDAIFYSGFQFEVSLPEGITCSDMTFQQTTKDENGNEILVDVVGPEGKAGTDIPASAAFVATSSYISQAEPQQIKFVCYSGAGNPITTSTGSFYVLEIPLNAAEGLTVGKNLRATISNIHFSTTGNVDIPLNDANFNIEIIDPYITLLDTETTAPNPATNENVRVVRTIKAGQWNTICLPFVVANPVAVFGEGVEIADFSGYDATVESDGTTISKIEVKFNSGVTTMEANHPYLIKVKGDDDIEQFYANNVNIDPQQAIVNCDETSTVTIPGYGTFPVTTTKRFIGTYVKTLVPENKLFVRSNNFYYSTGATVLNGYRGYFDFAQELTDKVKASSVKMNVIVDGEETAVDDIRFVDTKGAVYTLDGKFVGRDVDVKKLQKGIYVIDGKKVAIK